MDLLYARKEQDQIHGIREHSHPDPQTAYAPRPNTVLDFPNENGRMSPIRTDANGVRIDAPARNGDDRTPAIAVIGDSFVASLHTPDGETFSAQLGKELGRQRTLN